MNRNDKKYDAFSLFEELDNDEYYEIEYDSSPIPGAGKFVLKSQKIEVPVKDEVRDIFDRMRDIARDLRTLNFSSSKFYDKRVQQENSRIFYEQGMFMKEFEDHYGKKVTCSAYFPRYQMMGYDQLRTYFTWRTEVRNGYVEKTSVSFAFLYLYELLNLIGVEDAQDGLEKLMFFWKEFRAYDAAIDKYVLKWLKDYHIYYELPWTFIEFVEENDLAEYYPKLYDPVDNFEMYCSISKYDIRKSGFYTEDRENLIKNSFSFTMDRLGEVFQTHELNLEEAIFQPVKNMPVWEPFKGALFYPWLKQRDRRVVLSEKEIYICSQNKWTCSTALTTESGKQLVGYVMKQMESVLRRVTKYKYSITASAAAVNPALTSKLNNEGISLEKVITDAVMEFYREATRTVVKVDYASLEKIRQEALMTQEKLIVPEEEAWSLDVVQQDSGSTVHPADLEEDEQTEPKTEQVTTAQEPSPAIAAAGPWEELKSALSEVQLQALRILLTGGSVKRFADEHGIMLEVLMDGINEKAMDYVGDSLFDDEFTIYDDYLDDIKGMVEE